MKKQRMTTEARSFGFFKIALVLVMLVATVCCLAVAISAANKAPAVSPYDLEFKLNGEETPTAWSESFTMVYGDAWSVNVKDPNSNVKVDAEATQAANGKLDAGKRFVKVCFTDGSNLLVPVTVAPKTLTWEAGFKADGSAVYGDESASVAVVDALKDKLVGIVGDDAVEIVDIAAIALAKGVSAGEYEKTADITLDNENYIAQPLPVKVVVNALQIERIDLTEPEFAWGETVLIEVWGYVGEKAYRLEVKYDPKAATGAIGDYNYRVVSPDANNISLAGLNTEHKYHIVKKAYKVTADSFKDTTYSTTNAATVVSPTVSIEDLPADVLNAITYKGASTGEFGVFTITATLPTSANYKFVDENGNEVTTLTATLNIKNQNYLPAGNAEKPYQLIIYSPIGYTGEVTASVSTPEIANKALRGFPYYTAYELKIGGVRTDSFDVLIPVDASLYSKYCAAFTTNDLYIYNPITKEMTVAKESNGVSWEDGYFHVTGVSGESSVIFVVAPDYNPPFLLSPIGIALIALLIIALIVVMFLIGMYLRRLSKAENEEIVVETEGEVPEVVANETELADLEATTEERLDEMEATITEALDSAEPEADPEELAETKDASMAELMAEVQAIELDEEPVEAPVEEPAEVVEEEVAAEAVAEEVVEEEVAEEAVAEEAVVEEAAEEVVEEPAPVEEPAVEAVAIVEDEDEDGEEEEEEESFAFGDMDLDFFDAVEEADRYAELLEQESRGEVRIVTRYRRSFQSRMTQSQGNVQDYYSEIKNALLSYKGVKSRVSWNYDAFNRGRVHVAKINAKTKTLYLYLAIDPAELADTKYTFVDVSSKKKYATVPVLMKIKGERKFKHALELIEKICGENLQLPKMEVEAVDYRTPYATTEELVKAGVVKKLVASVPVVYGETAVSETPVEPVAPATEEQEVTFIAPTDAPAVEAAAEEVAANAEASENENSEI